MSGRVHVVVPRKSNRSGERKWRVVIDYRLLNKQIQKVACVITRAQYSKLNEVEVERGKILKSILKY